MKDAKSYEFGKGFTGSFTINANEIYTTPASFMISVAPVNAVVTNEMFSLINSKGELSVILHSAQKHTTAC